MVFIPLNVAPRPYQGQLYRFPVGLCVPVDPNLGPNTVKTVIDFSNYGITQANPQALIQVNLLAQAVQTPLDKVRSVYIDNSAGYTTVFVIFPDTGYVVTCPPHSISFQPVLTNTFIAQVFSAGFFFSLLPQVTIHFSNAQVSGYSIDAPGSSANGMFIGNTGGVSSPSTAFTATVPNLVSYPLGPSRILVAAICAQCTVTPGPCDIFAVTIEGVAATQAAKVFATDGAGNISTIAIFYALAPTGGTGAVTYNTTKLCSAGSVGLWAVYNSLSSVPYIGLPAFNNTNSNTINISPFVTKGGYCILASLFRAVGAPQGQTWEQAQLLGNFNYGNIATSMAEINGGDDDFISATVFGSAAAVCAAWQ